MYIKTHIWQEKRIKEVENKYDLSTTIAQYNGTHTKTDKIE